MSSSAQNASRRKLRERSSLAKKRSIVVDSKTQLDLNHGRRRTRPPSENRNIIGSLSLVQDGRRGRWGDGVTRRRGDGATGRRGDGAIEGGIILTSSIASSPSRPVFFYLRAVS